jgi:hypothetical protein
MGAENACASRLRCAEGPKRTTRWLSGRGIAMAEMSWSHSYTNSPATAEAVEALGAMQLSSMPRACMPRSVLPA